MVRFLTSFHGQTDGSAGLGRRDASGEFHTRLFEWPDQRDAMVRWLDFHGGESGLYYTPALFEYGHALRSNVRQVRAVWVDCDSAEASAKASRLPLKASLVVNTSPGKTQHLWLMGEDGLDPETATGVNLALTKATGGDHCWQVNHYLRLPYGWNWKYSPPPRVGIRGGSRRRYSAEEIVSAYPPAELPKGWAGADKEVEELLATTPAAAELIRQHKALVGDVALYGRRVEGGDRSNGFWGFAKDLARAGLSEGERLALALYVRDAWLPDKQRAGGLWTDGGVLSQVRKAALAVGEGSADG